MYQLFFTDEDINKIISSLNKTNNKDLIHNIMEQIFKKDLSIKEVDNYINIKYSTF